MAESFPAPGVAPPSQPAPPILLEVSAVVIAVADETPLVLTLRSEDLDGASRHALPSGAFDPLRHRTLEEAVRARVSTEAGLDLGYVEQLYTFADRYRDPRELSGGPRRVSVGYLALLPRARPSGRTGAEWLDLYDFLPWEDRRDGHGHEMRTPIAPRLREWIASDPEPATQRSRRERLAFSFPPEG